MGLILNNRGRLTDQVTGINGVNAGGTAVINLPTNQRYHRIILNITDSGSAAAVATVVTNVRILVNGVTIRDLSTTQILNMCFANGYIPELGELPLFFTEPFLTGGQINEPSDVTSWDMFGLQTFTIQLTIAAGVTPGVTGWYEYDFQRNVLADGKTSALQIVSQKQFSYATAAAQNTITTQPVNFPIRRIWMSVAAGSISQIIAKQDGNIVANFSTLAQMRQCYREYGFKFQQQDSIQYQNATGPANLSPYATLATPAYFNGALIFDPDGRIWKSLQVAQNLTLYITTSNATTLTLVQESVADRYAS